MRLSCRFCTLRTRFNPTNTAHRPVRSRLLPQPPHQQPIRLLHSTSPHKSNSDSPSSPTPSPPQSQPESLIYPSSPSQNHHDLPTFLSYAARTGLSPTSTVYIGTHYEYTVLTTLTSHGFHLRRIGGASDFGIDLLGTWTLPSLPRPLRVIIQCKALSSRSRPDLIRELEGAFVGAPPGWRGEGVLGLLVAPGPSTKGVRDAMARSKWPMGFVSCGREDGKVKQFLWNQAAVQAGLEGMGVGFRYDEGGEKEPSLVLTWKGRVLESAAEKEEG